MAKFRKAFDRKEVIVSLPKFRTETSATLEDILPKLGMKLAFTPQADFSGIRELKNGEVLYISKVAHKSFVDVDENGTEAAAATAVEVAVGSAMPMEREPPKVFQADHPFLYFIEETSSESVLFMGRLAQP